MSFLIDILTVMEDGEDYGIDALMAGTSLTHLQIKSNINKLKADGHIETIQRGQRHFKALYRITPAGLKRLEGPAPRPARTMKQSALKSMPALQMVWSGANA